MYEFLGKTKCMYKFNANCKEEEKGGRSGPGSCSDGMSTDEISAINNYRNFKSIAITEALIKSGGDLDKIEDLPIKNKIQLIDNAMKNNILDKDLKVFSGISYTLSSKLNQKGDVVKLPTYISGTKSKSMAHMFADKSYNYDHAQDLNPKIRTYIEVKLPKGFQAIDIGKISDNEDGKKEREKEVLLSRNHSYKVINIVEEKYKDKDVGIEFPLRKIVLQLVD